MFGKPDIYLSPSLSLSLRHSRSLSLPHSRSLPLTLALSPSLSLCPISLFDHSSNKTEWDPEILKAPG